MMFTTSLLVKDSKNELAVDVEESPSSQPYTVDYSISDANAVDGLRQQLALVAIATITTDKASESSNFTIHHAAPDYGLSLCQLINSHSFKRWLQQLSLFHPRQFDQTLSDRHIYCCQYADGSNGLSHYLTVWSKIELTPLQQFCIEQQARYFYQLERQQLEHQQMQERITGLEDVIRQIGHQLRTPLASIELYADILCNRLSTSREGEQAQAVQHLVRKLLTTLQRLTSKSVIAAASQQDLQTIAQDSIQELQPQLDKKRIALVGERPSYLLKVDSWQLQQVFNNLISNAIAFSPENGIIDFCWHGYNSEILIEIRDQGPGFSSEDLRHIFKQYYSRRPDGQGLGMTIAKKIVHDHGGNIWAKNLPHGGAQVSISLPRHR
ncbi:sensor histidine kinase [Leptothoe spongobia]|uniref:histidine kinase n=1 Tax=Leptothoe spongobia TAU-MAC 1115 TaxID=1967444 RepID=A0A947DGJ2_9CYAN|nr:HAMP domain-containing sensor histidine kinase [Leptothoe spongobia]MBT9316658.1 HAMP domain-containing histidine kinase [Leptothoe spongobia TAU-MAC 1115]